MTDTSEANMVIGPPPEPERGAGDPAPWSDPAPGTGSPAPQVLAGELEDDLPEVPEAIVRGLLASVGGLVGMTPLADDDVPDHWRFTPQELDDLTPALTRIVNRRRELRAALAHGDEAIVLVQLLGYTGRNVVQGAMARRARADREQELFGHDDFDRQAGDAAPAGDAGARAGAGWEQPGWAPAPPGTGVNPPAA